MRESTYLRFYFAVREGGYAVLGGGTNGAHSLGLSNDCCRKLSLLSMRVVLLPSLLLSPGGMC